MRVHVSPQPFIRFHTYDDCVCLWFLSLFTHALSIGPMAITVNTFFHGTAFIFRLPIDYLCVIAYFLCMLRTKENETMTKIQFASVEEEVLSDGGKVYNVQMTCVTPISGIFRCTTIDMPTMEAAWVLADMINETACDVTIE